MPQQWRDAGWMPALALLHSVKLLICSKLMKKNEVTTLARETVKEMKWFYLIFT